MEGKISIFINQKNLDLFLNFDGKINIHRASRRADITYSHASVLVNQIEELGLIKVKKIGRESQTELTKKGIAFKRNILRALKVLKGG